jgi:hypothetical protein
VPDDPRETTAGIARPTRVQWSDIAAAARETSEALNGKDWVNAGIKARVLLADLADEIDRAKVATDVMAGAIREALSILDMYDELMRGADRGSWPFHMRSIANGLRSALAAAEVKAQEIEASS